MEGLDMATQQYSRRAFASGASLAALATPVVAFPTLAAVNASPDHELIVLGAQLRRAHEEAKAASDAFHAAYKPMLDRAWDLVLETGADPHSKAADALYHEICLQLHNADPKYDELDHQQLAAWCCYDDIAARIIALPCQTVAGLAVKALLVEYSWPSCFGQPIEKVDGIDERHLRHLVDELVRMASA
jgi:hypothetical protein